MAGVLFLLLLMSGCAAHKPVKPSAQIPELPEPQPPADYYHRDGFCNTADPFDRERCIKRAELII